MSMRQVVDRLCARCYQPAHQVCSKCKVKWYCSTICQSKDWVLGHRHACGLENIRAEGIGATFESPKRCVFSLQSTQWTKLWFNGDVGRNNNHLPGLNNVGNSCYINAVLQALSHTEPFVSLLRSHVEPSSSIEKCTISDCFACVVGRYFIEHSQSKNGEFTPSELMANIRKFSQGAICSGSQEDVHEAWIALLKLLKSSLLSQYKGYRLNEREQDTTIIDAIFGGYIRSQLICPKKDCHRDVNLYNAFTCLEVEVTDATDSIQDMLESYTSPERLDKNNRYVCGKCSSKVRALKQISLWTAPTVLCLSLKRYKGGGDGFLGVAGKNDKFIRFDETLSNFRHFMTPEGDVKRESADGLEYRLFGVLVHLNRYRSINNGHYIAYMRSSNGPNTGPGSEWHCFNDETVTPVSREEVLSQRAYVLFYQRRSYRADWGGECTLISNVAPTISDTGSESPTVEHYPHLPTSGEDPVRGPCANLECEFFGSSDQQGYCSSCFRAACPEAFLEWKTEIDKIAAVKKAEAIASVDAEKLSKVKSNTRKPSRSRETVAINATPSPPPSRLLGGAQRPKQGVPKNRPNEPCPCGGGKKYKRCHGIVTAPQ